MCFWPYLLISRCVFRLLVYKTPAFVVKGEDESGLKVLESGFMESEPEYTYDVEGCCREWTRYDPVATRCRLVSFRSRSKGRGRKRRRPRDVDLLVVDNNHAYRIEDGEIKPRKNRGIYSQPDQLANEILDFLPEDERSVDNLMERVMAIARLGMRF
jgi:hypothetical protein